MAPPSGPDADWVSTYLQVVASLFIFGVGFPALLMQTVMSERVPHALRKPALLRWLFYASVIAPAAVTLVLAWAFDKCEDQGNVLDVLMSTVQWRAWIPPVRYDHLIGAGLMTFTIVCIVSVTLVLLRYRREQVLGRLTRQCAR